MEIISKTHKEVRLAARPSGLPRAEHFSVVDVPVPRPGPGEALVRNQYFRVAASLRMMIAEGAESVEGVPFPPMSPGDTLAEEALGEIVSAPAGSGLAPGMLVLHPFGWREYATVAVSRCTVVADLFADRSAHLSHGWTAYAALTRCVGVSSGDVVFVSSAAGAIGSMAGQIARLLGAKRIIGSTSSRAKAARLISELAYDAAIARADGPIHEQLAEAAPDGIDVVLDNVGGDQLAAAMAVASERARIAVLGALSGQLAATGTGRTAPVELDSFALLLKKITLRGYSADDDPDARVEFAQCFAGWLERREIVFPREIIHGIANGPEAIERAVTGAYFGAVIVAVS